MKLYKLTDKNSQTRNKTQWGPGVTNEATGELNQGLCSDGWIHAYRSPELAVLMDPIHGYFSKTAMLWEAAGEVGIDDGTKIGCRSLTTTRLVELPGITTEQRVTFAILCAIQVYPYAKFCRWAVRWLNGTDRSKQAAANAANAAYAAAYAAANAADAAYDADAAAKAAEAAAYAAAYTAAYAAADVAAADAAKAAADASKNHQKLDLEKIAKDALR